MSLLPGDFLCRLQFFGEGWLESLSDFTLSICLVNVVIYCNTPEEQVYFDEKQLAVADGLFDQ